jgi:hypothetical protein
MPAALVLDAEHIDTVAGYLAAMRAAGRNHREVAFSAMHAAPLATDACTR